MRKIQFGSLETLVVWLVQNGYRQNDDGAWLNSGEGLQAFPAPGRNGGYTLILE